MKSNPLSVLDAKMSPEALAAAKEKAADMLLDIRLAELREITHLSQVEISGAFSFSECQKRQEPLKLVALLRATCGQYSMSGR